MRHFRYFIIVIISSFFLSNYSYSDCAETARSARAFGGTDFHHGSSDYRTRCYKLIKSINACPSAEGLADELLYVSYNEGFGTFLVRPSNVIKAVDACVQTAKLDNPNGDTSELDSATKIAHSSELVSIFERKNNLIEDEVRKGLSYHKAMEKVLYGEKKDEDEASDESRGEVLSGVGGTGSTGGGGDTGGSGDDGDDEH